MAGRDYMYEHIVRVLLQAEIDTPIDILLRDANVTVNGWTIQFPTLLPIALLSYH